MSYRARVFPRAGAYPAASKHRYHAGRDDFRLSYRAALLSIGALSSLLWALIIFIAIKFI